MKKDLGRARGQAENNRLFKTPPAELDTDRLLPSPENGRKVLRGVESLAKALESDGMNTAITAVSADTYVSKYPQHKEHVESSGKSHVVLHGHRRLAAAQLAGLTRVPVSIRKTVVSMRIAAIQENELRLGLDPIEQGAEYQAALEEENLSQRGLAERLPGVSQTNISHRIKLLSLIPELQQAVINHWLQRHGFKQDPGTLLVPVKEAATVLADLTKEQQQDVASGTLSLDQAAAILESAKGGSGGKATGRSSSTQGTSTEGSKGGSTIPDPRTEKSDAGSGFDVAAGGQDGKDGSAATTAPATRLIRIGAIPDLADDLRSVLTEGQLGELVGLLTME
ncbi:ParB/RepB/Spo0J family partition protein [Streptomyces fractus]|uniref:ParB/RepB/Spo0J family partition protein n=1 Tax=Streptomyces fractus TaxID=641806 RepID=UPI003CF146F9